MRIHLVAVAILSALGVTTGLAAQAQTPCLVEDGKIWKQREWRWENMEPEDNEHWYRDIEQRFDGTKVIDGLTYNILKVRQTYPNLTDEYEVAYMREENGRVYTRGNVDVPVETLLLFYCDNFLYHEAAEALVYDFNLNVGDTYRWFSDPEIIARYQDSFCSWAAEPVEVESVRTVEYKENTFRAQTIKYRRPINSPLKYEYFCSKVIERVGSRNGILPYPGLSHEMETGGIYDIEVIAPDGTVIYKTDIYNQENGIGAVSRDNSTLNYTLHNKHLAVYGISGSAEVRVINMQGCEVLRTKASAGDAVDLSELAHGIYLISLTDNQDCVTTKIEL